jgi:hypothetical protein
MNGNNVAGEEEGTTEAAMGEWEAEERDLRISVKYYGQTIIGTPKVVARAAFPWLHLARELVLSITTLLLVEQQI